MQPLGVGIMRWAAVAGLISEQSERNASPPTSVIHVLTHDSRAQECPSVGLMWSFECGDYAAMCCVGCYWNVWRQKCSLVAWIQQKQHAVVSPQWTDKIWGTLQSMGKLRLTVNRTAVIITGARFRPLTMLSRWRCIDCWRSGVRTTAAAAWERKERSLYACTC